MVQLTCLWSTHPAALSHAVLRYGEANTLPKPNRLFQGKATDQHRGEARGEATASRMTSAPSSPLQVISQLRPFSGGDAQKEPALDAGG